MGFPFSSRVNLVGAENYAALLTEPGLSRQDFMISLRNPFYYVLGVVQLPDDRLDRLAAKQSRDTVGQLHLVVSAGLETIEALQDGGGKNVAADHGVLARSGPRRFLDDAGDLAPG